jgi:hypothetical protein
VATNEDIVTPIPGIDNLTYEDANVLLKFQKLWIETITWLRNAFHSALGNLPDQSATETQLFQKLPTDIFNEFKQYFSEEESQQFLNYYYRLISDSWQIVSAYKGNDKTAIDLSIAQWNQTADELATFLARINKYWDENQLKTLFHNYLNFIINVITAFLNGNYDLETKMYDELQNIAIQIASYMAMGIIKMQHTS